LIALTRRQRRRRALAEPFPDSWRALLAEQLVHWNLLDADERRRLEELVRLFLVDKKWEAANGLELTDRMRVLISAMACLLALGFDADDPYPGVTWIEVQPSTMAARGPRRFGAEGVVSDAVLPIVGQTSFTGPVFIAWDAARDGARHPERGHNVVYHEFAHQLDMNDGLVDGTPVLADDRQRRRWIEVCTAVYESVRDGRGGDLLDAYAGVNPGEFFAVATEVFFDRPVDLERMHPDLYDVLRGFYRQDPAVRQRRG
jgi:MtfA peptidase